MGFSDVWNRTLVYFGIAEEDEDWDEDGYVTNEELERSYGERPNVRRLSPRRRNRGEFEDWTDPEPQRLAFDLERLMRTEYKIDTYQANYFVIDSFRQLFEATAPDFTPIYAAVRRLPPLAAGVRLPGERGYPPSTEQAGGVRT